MNINERIRYLRKEKLDKTQEAFGEPLGLSRANIANIESGRISVTERVIIGICDKYGVNEEWIRTGVGDPLLPKTRNQMIIDFAGDIIKDDDESFRKRLLEALAQLESEEWAVLENIARKTLKKD